MAPLEGNLSWLEGECRSCCLGVVGCCKRRCVWWSLWFCYVTNAVLETGFEESVSLAMRAIHSAFVDGVDDDDDAVAAVAMVSCCRVALRNVGVTCAAMSYQ